MSDKPLWGFGEMFDFTHQHSPKGKLWNIGKVFLACLGWTIGIFYFFFFLSNFNKPATTELFVKPLGAATAVTKFIQTKGKSVIGFPSAVQQVAPEGTPSQSGPPLLVAAFFTCVLTPFWEEAFFRAGPLTRAQSAVALQRSNILPPDSASIKKYLFWSIIVWSIGFGLAHGSPANILIQGFAGLSFAWLYLKNGNSYWSVVIAHSMWNTFLMFGIPVFVQHV